MTDDEKRNPDEAKSEPQRRAVHVEQGHRLSELRNQKDIAPQALAQSVGITLADLIALESGTMKLTDSLARRIAKELDVAYSDLWIH